MRMICRILLIAIMLNGLASLTIGQINRRITAGVDSGRVQPTQPTDSASQILELRCRGGGLDIRITPGEMREFDLWMNMTVRFTHAGAAAGITGKSLAPGQCALPDRALLSSEPTEMRGDIIDFGQRNRKIHGDPVYNGDIGAERYPDALNVPPYLSNPNHYWSFFAVNSGGYFRFTNLHYWKPVSAPDSTERLQTPASAGQLQTPGRSGMSRLGAPASSRTEGDTEPIPANAVGIYIRYSKELGYLGIGGGGAFGGKPAPYSCDAFNVDANPNVGLGHRTSDKVRAITNPNDMRTEGSYYVCGFTVEYLPQNVPITVTANMVNDSRILTGPWSGEGQPRPPRGYERSILKGVQNIILTKKNPSEIVTFEMVYAPATSPPR